MGKILCGPILRRTEKNKVSVWAAFNENYLVELQVFQGDHIKVKANPDTNADLVSVGDGADSLPLKAPAQAVTARFGKNLWMVVVTAEPVNPFAQNQVYSYNINFRSSDTPTDKGDLRTQNMLEDGTVDGKPQKALGYAKNTLPGFILPSEEPENLFIAHASCRKLHGHGNDALSYLDKLIEDSLSQTGNPDPFNAEEPTANLLKQRPQQLYFTGDQIYADDVSPLILHNLGVLDGASIFGDEKVQVKKTDGSIEEIEADKVLIPPLYRRKIVLEQAGFSSEDCDSHLITFEEFVGLYLMSWSLRSWQTDFYNDLKTIKTFDSSKASDLADKYIQDPLDSDLGLLPIIKNHLNSAAAAYVYSDEDKLPFQAGQTDKLNEWKKETRRILMNDLRLIGGLVDSIPLVSRVLANVPTYMIFDDHEITDDWYMTKRWRHEVLSNPLGRDIIRNGLMAYTLFQDWGNTPDKYVAIPQAGEGNLSNKTKLIRLINEYANRVAENNNLSTLRTDVFNEIETYLGMGSPDDPKIVDWHYQTECGPTKVIVLNTRTRRSYASLNSSPGLISEDSLNKQVPATAPVAGASFTIVVSAAPFFGLQSFEQLVQPAASAISGAKSNSTRNPGILSGELDSDKEAWGFDKVSFEALLERLAEYEKVILLSGDVHYGFSSVMDYWKGTPTDPKSRLIQFTSSSLKNESYGLMRLYRASMTQKLLNGIGDKLEKLVWKDKVLSVSGQVSMRNRIRLRNNPAVLPVAGWKSGATVSQPPDYRYRLKVVADNRVNRKSEPIHIDSDINLSDAASLKDGYKKIVQRSQADFITEVHRRMVWPSHVGLISFKKDTGNKLSVSQSFLFNKGDLDPAKKDIKLHIVHEIPFEAAGNELVRPELP